MITEWQIVSWEVGIKCWGGQSRIVNTPPWLPQCAPDQTPNCGRPHLPLPHASSLNNVAALSRWHLVAYFLSKPFISCHFSEASQVAAAKRNGRWLEVTDTQQHSGHRQHPGHWERRAVLWIKHCVCVYCEGLEGRWGGPKHAFSNLHMNIKN